ncbi:hypothetical protein [uncultured Maritalea sp.]|uniref:hypothetical protein n=1 Tax=uncultured Maritalea sp. TaxID=757249 RepID=UPI002629E2B8|nr:hypothetical protein [uncultured Maritalea sp.]
MAKQLIIIVLLTGAAIFFQNELNIFLDALLYAHAVITQALQIAFSEGSTGILIQKIIALLLLPLFSGMIVATIYWLFKRTQMPHTMAIIWTVWLVLLVAITSNYSEKNKQQKP